MLSLRALQPVALVSITRGTAGRFLVAALPVAALLLSPPAAGPPWLLALQLVATAAWIRCTLAPLWGDR